MKNYQKVLLIIIIVIGVIIGIIVFGNKKSNPTQSVTITPSTNQNNEDIWKTIKTKSTGISPLLYPEKLPSGLQTQKIIKSVPGAFFIEYTGVNKKLHIGVEQFNPGEIDAKGSQIQITVRGQNGTLQLKNAAIPSEYIWLWWQEPGTWETYDGQKLNKVFYMISAEGFTPQEIQSFAESLKPLK